MVKHAQHAKGAKAMGMSKEMPPPGMKPMMGKMPPTSQKPATNPSLAKLPVQARAYGVKNTTPPTKKGRTG